MTDSANHNLTAMLALTHTRTVKDFRDGAPGDGLGPTFVARCAAAGAAVAVGQHKLHDVAPEEGCAAARRIHSSLGVLLERRRRRRSSSLRRREYLGSARAYITREGYKTRMQFRARLAW